MTQLQTLTMNPQKQVVLKTIDSLGRKVTAADVALKSGLPVLAVEQDLNEIAAETKGNLKVGEKGDIVYTYPVNFEATYLSRGVELFFQRLGDWFFKAAFFLLRISFGVMLVLSFVIVVVLIFLVIMFYSRIGGRDSDNDRGYDDYDGGFGGGGFHLGFWDWMLIRELFLWQAYSRDYRCDPYDRYNRPTIHKPQKTNFLFNVFSFLFGDGDPNGNLEERKWAMIAEAIRENNGVVTADQLAPYTGSNEDDAMLPVLVRFQGKPVVTDAGNIVYEFSSLKATAQSPWPGELPQYLSEFTWKFSNVRSDQLLPVYILAALNFIGSWFLFLQMDYISVLYKFAPLIQALVVYGTLFLVVPAVRAFGISVANKNIEERNKERMQYWSKISAPQAELEKKLEEAKRLSFKREIQKDQDSVYTTEKDVLDQEFDS